MEKEPIRLIGLGYKKRSGKDTVCEFIQHIDANNRSNQNPFGDSIAHLAYFQRRAFADRLKEVCGMLAPLDFFTDYGKEAMVPNTDMTGREFLQAVGVKMREINPKVWVDSVFTDLKEHSRWIITDVRFLNEAWEIKKRGGILVHIHRELPSDDTHVSETELDDFNAWDYRIDNNGTKQELADKVYDMMKHFEII